MLSAEARAESDRDRQILERAALELAAQERAARAEGERERAAREQEDRLQRDRETAAREQEARERSHRELIAREQQAAHEELARAEALRVATEGARAAREQMARDQAAQRQTEAQQVLRDRAATGGRERAATGGRERPTRSRSTIVRSPRERRPQPRLSLQKTDAAQVAAWAAEVDGFSRYGFGSRGIVVHNGSPNRMTDVVIAVSWAPSAPPAVIGLLPPGTFYLAQQPGDAVSGAASWAYPEAVDQLGADVRALPATESHAVLEVGFRDDEGRPWRRAVDGTLTRGR